MDPNGNEPIDDSSMVRDTIRIRPSRRDCAVYRVSLPGESRLGTITLSGVEAQMTAIRRAFDADADGIRRVARAAWHDAYDSLDSEVIDETISDWYADPLGSALHGWAGGVPANDLDDIEATPLVAEQDGEIIGFTQGITMHTMGRCCGCTSIRSTTVRVSGTARRPARRPFGARRRAVRALDLASNDRSRESSRISASSGRMVAH